VVKNVLHDEISAEVVKLLVAERKRRGISGNSLAEKSGLSQSLISTLETNPWNPTLDTLLRIGEALQIDVGEVISKARTRVLRKQGRGGKAAAPPPLAAGSQSGS
jgi:transcriptional regulator with XRE-family HTH domain